jgi:hypothetical protein
MSTYFALGLPEAWKPLLKVVTDAGWELEAVLDVSEIDSCRYCLDYGPFFLSFWEEPEWCGNNLQTRGLTVATLTAEEPTDLHSAEEHALLLTGRWENEATDFVDSFLRELIAKSRAKML